MNISDFVILKNINILLKPNFLVFSIRLFLTVSFWFSVKKKVTMIIVEIMYVIFFSKIF